MSGLAEQASRSVIVLHELIAEVFHGDGSKVPELLAHFAPEFTMVTPGGKMLALADVAALFTRLTGGRQGVVIRIEQCQIISQSEQDVVIHYHELQQQGDVHTHRISLAVIDCSATSPRWRYLQETMVAD
ncbi:hypothetical protein WB66_14935 [bacteria symbiont BFo1 of Frankliniella occidentalis]|nr:hypothetical protein AI28_19940 [bacteria symbiont BFo1 of Frankliniella occidentalis]KYP83895.1 hypothetical protein WB66_14935 [bacteria symbiont BFo1 of Frankliniella occidentalis]KYP89271.1 hypothetical protein WB91_13770 [bacteria symbiont BFo1 of Frankliniella occidentalis]